MSSMNPYEYNASGGVAAAYAEESARATFIRRTYLHLAGAVIGLVAIEALLFALVPADTMRSIVGRLGGMGWLVMLGGFMLVSWVARAWAESGRSRGMQYMGLSLYVFAEAILLLPLLYIAMRIDPNTPMMAALITCLVFAGLTGFVFVTGVDLHWMGRYLFIAGMVAFGMVACSVIFGFSMGILFSAVMVGLASMYIVYDTSNIIHHYRTDQHVAASLALFASVVLLFWYVLRILMAFAAEE